ncbi:MAG TPA: DUF5103 domain-containing protein [Prolixibacteraceae bacterium]|nr:DUF5103 domain-containing protein [Prolixibacteraceae bacterium]
MTRKNLFLLIKLKIKLFILALLILSSTNKATAVSRASEPLNNAIFRENIRSVQFFREGWDFSQPVLELGADQRLLLKFDEITDGVTNFVYTITHCDSEWYPSRLVQSEYMEGFIENPVTDYAASVNTTSRYTNYLLTLPNENVRFRISGNYLLTVFDERNRSAPVLTRRFYIVEPSTDIRGEVKKATFEGYKGRDQEVDFTVDYSRFSMQDPRTEVKVVVTQNSRSDNSLTNLKPLFVRENQLSYDLSRENVFAGGNEFRNFDTKNIRMNGLGVVNIEYINPTYHIELRTDRIRRERDYSNESDLNGRYLIKNDRVTDSDLEADYVLVHFSLQMPEPLLGGGVYVFGGLSDWQCQPANKMKWNFESKLYEAAILLKQGFYDYQYVYIQNGGNKIDDTLLEGSYVETENDYQIFVYYRGFSSRYDKLIGYRTINSVKR